MKKFLLGLLLFPLLAFAEPLHTPLAYLNAMHQAHQTANFELLYLFKQGEELESLRYRHATSKGKEYAQLLRLDNAREEIILRDHLVSYFGYNFKPFSLSSRAILDSLPSAFYSQFSALENYYHFVDGGKARVADRIVRLIRVLPRDEFRYKYHLWIDEESHLLLKSELLDRENNLLEEFRVLQAHTDDHLVKMIAPIESLALPTLLNHEGQTGSLNWQVKWLPEGFKEISAEQQSLSDIMRDEKIEGRLYSDGLFSFSIYLVENKGIPFNEQFWRQDKLSIYSHTIGNKDIVIVGEIPLSTAKYIVQQLQFEENPK